MQHMGLTQVTAPTNNQDPKHTCYTMQPKIKKACLEEAKRQFTQVKDTPMLQPPMINLVGINNMDAPAFSQILNGTFKCPENCDLYLQKLLPHLQQREDLPSITIQMYKEYKCSWETARETTASSPSLVHFGHYIATIADDTIGKLNAILANVWLLSRTAPEHWKHTLNVMLEKLVGNDNMEKLRIIMLFKADFNNNNKWLTVSTPLFNIMQQEGFLVCIIASTQGPCWASICGWYQFNS